MNQEMLLDCVGQDEGKDSDSGADAFSCMIGYVLCRKEQKQYPPEAKGKCSNGILYLQNG